MQLADNQQQRNREDTMRKAIKRGLNTITVQDVLGRTPYPHTERAQPELFSETGLTDAVNITPDTALSPALLTKATRATLPKEENIDITALLKKQTALMQREQITRRDIQAYGATSMSRQKGLRSLFYDPLLLDMHRFGPVHTVSPHYGRMITYRILRRVSEKAWILNLCISNLIKKVRPFLKPSTEENTRGFRITAEAAKERSSGMTAAEKKQAKALEDFLLHTGDIQDPLREDDLDKYVSKIIRDICQLDQIACELQRKQNGELCAFWAVDPATIEIALPLSEEATGIKYVQVIDNIPYAYYPREGMIFDCMNPRTDIERAGYGYSVVEQAIDLITSSINTFMFNAGFFIENKLPRGLLLLNGDADSDEVETIEEYIVNIMSGPPSSQWRIPIIPAGKTGGAGNRQLEWVNLQGTNKEMEFQAWFDLQLSGIVGLFGFSMEDLGLHSQKSAPLIGGNTSPKIETSKSLVLGDILSFLQKHFNRILADKNPAYRFEFIGYEKNDVKLILDLDKGEIESYKTIDEKRKEKGLPPFNEKWSKVPLNAQAVQMYQSEQEGAAGGGMIDEGEDVPPDFDDEGSAAGDAEMEDGTLHDGDLADATKKQQGSKKTGWDTLSKSLSKAIKITI